MLAAWILLLLLAAPSTDAGAREKPIDVLFEKADTDHNGVLSEQEWHAAMHQRFQNLDTNKDGALARDEMEQARQERLRAFRGARANNPQQ